MNKVIFFLSVSLIALASCDTVKTSTPESVNKNSEAVENVASKFKEGTEKAPAVAVKLSGELNKHGVKAGKSSLENDPKGGINNLLTISFTFEKDIEKTIIATAYDKKGGELGVSKKRLEGVANESKNIEFAFDSNTVLDVKSTVVIK